MKKKTYKPNHGIEAAEPRLLFSAGLEGVLAAQDLGLPSTDMERPAVEQSVDLATTDNASTPAVEPGVELIFVDSDTPEYQKLLDDLLQYPDETSRYEVIVLDETADGLTQITRALDNYTNLRAVHILSHGSDGAIDLGSGLLDANSVAANAETIRSWSNAFSDSGDLLIYGCNLAASAEGQMLVNSLATLTGTDVAASDDLTGNAALGGDWDLEYRTGSVEASVALNAAAQAEFQGVLNAYVVSNTNATGAGSLHQAITDANANVGVADTITFNIGGGGPQTIAVDAGGLPVITDPLILDATTQPGYSGTPLITLDGSATPAASGINGIQLRTNDSTVMGFIVHSFADEGIEIDGSTGFGDNNIIQNNWVGFDAAGVQRGNAEHGIMVAADATGNIVRDNVSAGNGVSGIIIKGGNVNNNTFTGNTVGIEAVNGTAMGNGGHGIEIIDTAANNVIGGVLAGEANIIANNAGDGIFIASNVGTGNDLRGNSIYSNGGIGIDLQVASEVSTATANDTGVQDADSGSNNLQNYPHINRAVVQGGEISISGYLDSTGLASFDLDFFSGNASGAAETYLGSVSVVTDASGYANYHFHTNISVPVGAFVTATATSVTDGTSELGVSVGVLPAQNTLWISTDGDAAPPGADGLPGGWLEGDVLDFGGPDLGLGAATDGDFSRVIAFDQYVTGTSDPGALHYVSSNITVGSGADRVDLRAGDVLVSFNQDETILGAYYETGVDTLVGMNDLLAFRPDTPGDYSSGTFYMLLNGVPDSTATPISSLHAISLVEQDTMVGSTLLQRGSFLFAEQAGAAPNNIYHFTPTVAGKNAATGTTITLIDGSDIGIDTGNIRGLELVEWATTVGGVALNPGNILVTLGTDDAAVGNNNLATTTQDIFVLSVTDAEPDTGTTAATASMLLDGSDVNLDNGPPAERIYAIALTPENVRAVAQDDRVGLSFDGVDDYVLIGDDPGLVMTSTMTMEAWINPDAGGTGTQIIINKEGEYEVGITADTGEIKWAFDNTDPDWTWHNTGYFANAGVWTHIAVTYNSGIVNTYANGMLVNSYNGSGPIGDTYTGMNELRIGARENAATQRFDGQIDEVRIWSTTRSEGEIKAAMDGVLAGNEPGLAGYWRFDEGAGSTVYDLTVNSNHGILGGADAPAAEPAWSGYVTDEGTVLNIPAGTGVLANDVDDDNDALTASNLDTTGTLGLVVLNADGSFTYDPNGQFDYLAPGEYATDTFTYTANDGTGDSNTATVTITITGVNDAPVVNATASDTGTEDTDVVYTHAQLLTLIGATDVDDANASLSIAISNINNGTLVMSGGSGGAGTTFTFTPTANFVGNLTFDYQVSDDDSPTPASSAVGTATVALSAVNDAPTHGAGNIPAIWEDDTNPPGETVANLFNPTFTDPDTGATLAGVAITSNTAPPSEGIWEYSTDGGSTWYSIGAASDAASVVFDATARLRFVPAPDFNGGPTVLLSRVLDNTYGGPFTNGVTVETLDTTTNGGTTPVSSTLRNVSSVVLPVNDAPVTNDASASGSEDATSIAITLTGSDIEGTVDFFRLSGLPANGTLYTDAGLTTVAATATDYAATAEALTLYFVPNTNWNGVTTFDFAARDNNGLLDATPATATITVNAVNDAPVANDDTYNVTEGGGGILPAPGVMLNDTDVDSGSLTAIQVSNVSYGTLTLNANGSWWYTRDPNYNGVDSFTYKVNDGSLDSNIATVTINIAPVNDAPAGSDNTVTTLEDTDYTFTSTDFGFTDPVEGDSFLAVRITTLPAAGTLVLAGSGAVTAGDYISKADIDANKLIFTPAPNANGTGYASFTFQVQDDGGTANGGVDLDQSPNTMTIDVTAVNDAPVADAGGAYSINEGDGIMLDASASMDVDGNPLSYSWDIDNDGMFGDATGISPSLTWAQLQAFTIADDGTYTIQVRVDDGMGGSDTTSATLTVNNTSPTLITFGAAAANEGEVFTLNLGSVDPGDDTITSWKISWGDGSIETIAGNPGSVTHVYSGGGTYAILASAADEDGVHMQNELLVPSFNRDSVYRFDKNTGAFLQEFGSIGDGLDGPYNMRIGPDGNVYVPGYFSGNIVRYDASGNFIDEFVPAGTGGLANVYDIAFGPDGNMYVASAGNRVFRFDAGTGAFIDVFATTAADGLSGPIGLMFDSEARLYVSGYVSNNVLRYDISDGSVIDEFISPGAGGGNSIEAMTTGPDGHLYIVSFATDSILRFDGATGAFIDTFIDLTATGLDGPNGLAFGPDGNLYVTGYNSHQVQRFDGTTGAYIDDYIPALTAGLARPGAPEFVAGHRVTINGAPDMDTTPADLAYTENDGAVAVDPALRLVDYDTPNISSATVAITGNYINGEDVLAFADTANITGSWDAANGVLTLSGADSVAAYQAALRSVTYLNNSENPDPSTRTVDFTANDGSIDSNVGSRDITVTPMNDAPTTNDASSSGSEDATSIAITLTGGDIDGTVDNYVLNGLPANGTLYIDAGLTTVAATATDYAATAEALTLYFVPNANWNGVTTFDFAARDNNGLLDATPATATITVNAVNDVPVATASSVTTNEDTAHTFVTGDFSYSDVEGDALVSVTFSNLNLASGTLEHSGGTAVTNGMTLTAAQIASLVYTPAGDANGAPLATFDFTVNDADAGVTAAQMDIDVTPVNDAPTTNDASASGSEDATSIAITLTGGDIDGTVDNYVLNGLPANGTLYIDAGLTTVAATATDYAATAEALTLYFVPNANWNGVTTFDIAARDNNGLVDATPGTATITVNAVNDAPAGVPVVTGPVQEDQVLTADTSGISDADGLGAFSYQWLRNGTFIAGANAGTYTLGDADVGTQISVQVTYIDGYGTSEGPLVSAQVGPVANVNDVPVGIPTITGLVQEDQVLTADTSGISDADGLGAFSYQWLRDGAVITGATGGTYTLDDADVGTMISVQVSYTDSHGTGEGPLLSAQVGPVANVNDAPVGAVLIDNATPTEGDLLTASNTLSDADGLSGLVSYQWLRDGVAIAGASGSTYTVMPADIGTVIRVVASYTDDHGTNESVTSSPTAAVDAIYNNDDVPIDPGGGKTVDDNPGPDGILTDDGSGNGGLLAAPGELNYGQGDEGADINYQVRPYEFQEFDYRDDGMLGSMLSPVKKVADMGTEIVLDLSQLIDLVRMQLSESGEKPANIFIRSVGGITLSISAGLVTWLARGGVIAAGMITSMPILKGFDPLVVMKKTRDTDEERDANDIIDDSVDRMFEGANVNQHSNGESRQGNQ